MDPVHMTMINGRALIKVLTFKEIANKGLVIVSLKDMHEK